MAQDIRLIAFDLDDTALDEEKKLREVVAETLAEALRRGYTVLPATGRMRSGIPKAVLALPGLRYAITSNGAKVYNLAEDAVLYSDCFTKTTAKEVLHDAMQEDGFISIFIAGVSYTPNRGAGFLEGKLHPAILQYLSSTRIHVDNPVALIENSDDHVEKITVNYADEETRSKARQRLAARSDITISSSIGLNLELNTKTANKGAALLWLAGQLGFSPAQVMAVGDSNNDIDMLKAAGYGVAMGGASEAVRRAAKAVAPPVGENGLAQVVRALWER